jgi:hypothetical protein
VIEMAVQTLRVPRSRGAFSAVLLVLLGLWGGLVPLIGPYLHYAYSPDKVWTVTSGRTWLEFLPAAGAIVGGIILLASKLRPLALLGASLAVLSGAWFALGSVIVTFWMRTPPAQGVPVGGAVARAAEQIGFFTGLGVVIVCVAAVAVGRLLVVSVRDSRSAERAAMVVPDTSTDDLHTSPSRRGTGVDAPEQTASSARKTPMAVLTRIASRGKPAEQSADDTADTGATSRAEKIRSGAGRR